VTSVFLPLLAALVASAALAPAARRVPPRAGAWLVAAAIGSVFVTVVVTAWVVVAAAVAHEPALEQVLGWCRPLRVLHHHPPRWVVGPAVVVAVGGVVRAARVARHWRGARGDEPGAVEVLDTDVAVAFARTGGGGVVVSTGMLAALDADERRAVLAHEHAHLRHRHDRFLVVACLASGVLPLLPAAAQLRRCLERWADEEAAIEVGGRAIVARAIARAALCSSPDTGAALALLGPDVPGRVEALLRPSDGGHRLVLWSTIAALVGSVAVGAAALQLHHIGRVVALLCGM